MRIGEVALEAGVSTKAIRYYEQLGLMAEPRRADNGYREYDGDAISRLRFIRDAQATGLTLSEIASILELRSQGETSCEHVVGLLERHIEELDRHIDELKSTRAQLDSMTQQAKRLDPASCSDPVRCQTITAEAGATPIGDHHAAPQRHVHG